MGFFLRVRRAAPAVLLVAVLAGGCGGGSSSGPSADRVRSATAGDVEAVLRSHDVAVKGSISCFGQAPGIVDCRGTTADGRDVQATLNASTSGKSCTGPMVVNVDRKQLASSPDERCA